MTETTYDDWLDAAVQAEEQLLAAEHTPAALVIHEDDADPYQWLYVLRYLLDRGWRVVADEHDELWFYPPSPHAPGPVLANLN